MFSLRIWAEVWAFWKVVLGVVYAYTRIQSGLPMPGLFEVNRRVSVGLAIEEILLIAECSFVGKWDGQVRFLPLR